MVENLDWNVGRVLEAVEAEGVAENTYLIYFSAHGDMYEKHER
jgi:arylsulfatase A-like enzyme